MGSFFFILILFTFTAHAVFIVDGDQILRIDEKSVNVNYLHGPAWNFYEEQESKVGTFRACAYHVPMTIEDDDLLITVSNLINAIRAGKTPIHGRNNMGCVTHLSVFMICVIFTYVLDGECHIVNGRLCQGRGGCISQTVFEDRHVAAGTLIRIRKHIMDILIRGPLDIPRE